MSFSENLAIGFRQSEMSRRWNALIKQLRILRALHKSWLLTCFLLSHFTSIYDQIECTLQRTQRSHLKMKKIIYSSVQFGPELQNEIAIVFRRIVEVFMTCDKCSYTNSYVSCDLLVICSTVREIRWFDCFMMDFSEIFAKKNRSLLKFIDSTHFVQCIVVKAFIFAMQWKHSIALENRAKKNLVRVSNWLVLV